MLSYKFVFYLLSLWFRSKYLICQRHRPIPSQTQGLTVIVQWRGGVKGIESVLFLVSKLGEFLKIWKFWKKFCVFWWQYFTSLSEAPLRSTVPFKEHEKKKKKRNIFGAHLKVSCVHVKVSGAHLRHLQGCTRKIKSSKSSYKLRRILSERGRKKVYIFS